MEETSPTVQSKKKIVYIVTAALAILLIGGVVLSFAAGVGSLWGGWGGYAPNADIDRNMDGSTTYSTDEGTVTVGGNSMPENWPSDAPKAYDGATIVYSGATNPRTGQNGSAIVYTVKASEDAVIAYYDAGLKAEGWTVTVAANAGGMKVLTATKDTRAFGVYVGSDGQGNASVTAGIQL